MKKTQLFINNKIGAYSLLIAGFLALGSISSCSKDEDSDVNTEITVDDAADVVEYATSSETDGLAAITFDASSLAADLNVYEPIPSLNCGQIYTRTYTSANSGAVYAYTNTTTRNYKLNCNGNDAVNFEYSFNRSGDYTGPKQSATTKGSGTLWFTDLSGTSDAVVNGEYSTIGSQQSNVRRKNAYTSTVKYTLSSVTISKTTNRITGGVAAVYFDGVSSLNRTFSYSGTVTFNGDGTAILVLNGHSYNIIIKEN